MIQLRATKNVKTTGEKREEQSVLRATRPAGVNKEKERCLVAAHVTR